MRKQTPLLLVLSFLLPAGLRAQSVALPQTSVAGKPAYQLDRPVITPKVVAPTDVFPHPPLDIAAFGAKCNGVTDDTKAIQDAIDTACHSPAHPPVYIPTSANGCLFTRSMNITSGNGCVDIVLEGDIGARGRSGLVAKFPSTQRYPALDFLGCKRCGLDSVNLLIADGSYATLGVLDGLYGNTGDGSGFRCRDSTISTAYPGPSDVPAILIYMTDEDSFEDCHFNGSGAGAVIGNGMGRANSIVSEYGPIGRSINSMTQFSCRDCMFNGMQGGPALQLTGLSDTYTFSGKTYSVITDTSSNSGGVVELTTGTGQNTMAVQNFRIENQSRARNVCAIDFDSPRGDLQKWMGTLQLDTDYGFCTSRGTTQGLSNSVINVAGGKEAFNWSGALGNDIINWVNLKSLGTIGSVHASIFKLGTSVPVPTLLGRTRSVGSSEICNNSGCQFTDMTVDGELRLDPQSYPIVLNSGMSGQNIVTAAAPSSGNVTFSIPAANSNPVIPQKFAPAGECVSYIDSGSRQHFAKCGSRASGAVTLAAGKAAVATTAACNVSGNCLYYLTNCGGRGTVGMLSVGAIAPGSGFVINSSSGADTSRVCWAIKGN